MRERLGGQSTLEQGSTGILGHLGNDCARVRSSMLEHLGGSSRASMVVPLLEHAEHKSMVRGLSNEGSQGPIDINIGDGKDCVINGAGASAGDFWHRTKVVGESAGVSEVGQCKLYSHSAKLSSETFRNERTKSANARDFFIFYTSAKDSRDIRLPPRSAIIDGVEPQGRYGCLWWKALFVCVGGARWEKGCNHFVYLDNFFRR